MKLSKKEAALIEEVRALFEEIKALWPQTSPAMRGAVRGVLLEDHFRVTERFLDALDETARARGRGAQTARDARTWKARVEDQKIRSEVERLARRPMSDRAIAKRLKISRDRVARILGRRSH